MAYNGRWLVIDTNAALPNKSTVTFSRNVTCISVYKCVRPCQGLLVLTQDVTSWYILTEKFSRYGILKRYFRESFRNTFSYG
jgi:hypothetical protein